MTEGDPWSRDHHHTPAHLQDTDAICENCGTVNPEDTLHCRQCGNNLRDQRIVRMAQTTPIEPQVTAVGHAKRWLGHLLVVFGLLLILWTAINMSNIEEWLTTAQTVPTGEPSGYWSGEGSEAFDAIAASLVAVQPATAQVGDPMAPREGFEGTYVLMLSDGGRDRRVGVAEVQAQGDKLIFVARLRRGFEVRGQGRIEDKTFVIQDAGGRMGDEYVGGNGFVQPRETGGYKVYVVSDANDSSYELTALALVPPASGNIPAP